MLYARPGDLLHQACQVQASTAGQGDASDFVRIVHHAMGLARGR